MSSARSDSRGLGGLPAEVGKPSAPAIDPGAGPVVPGPELLNWCEEKGKKCSQRMEGQMQKARKISEEGGKAGEMDTSEGRSPIGRRTRGSPSGG